MTSSRLFTVTAALAASLLVWSALPGKLRARELLLAGPAELSAALKAARPGDILTLKNGTWQDASLVVAKGGAADRPVEIRAESPGGVTLSGQSSLTVNAAYVTVDGLLFQGGAIERGAVIQFNSHHGTVRNTAIIDYNPAAFATEYYWVFFNGNDNVVDRCYFKGKNNLQPLIGNAIEDSRRNSVTRSYFKNIPHVEKVNGREIIRVWGSGKIEERDDDGAYFTIADNLFDHADGEGTETISLKSNHNVVKNNTVIATRGGINIRRGNFNRVTDNIVLGQGVEGAHGLRMSGRDNVVQGNFVSGVDYGIRVSCGEYIADALTSSYAPDVKPNGRRTAQVRIPTYPQVLRLQLANNTIVGCSGADMEIGSDYRKHWPESQQVLLPEDCVIRDNRIVRPALGESVIVTFADRSPPLDRFTFKPNRYANNVLVGHGTLAGAARDGFVIQDIPADWKESQESSSLQPLTPADVGPAWIVTRRQSGDLTIEDAPSGPPSGPTESKNKKKKR
ncbi:MAG: polysaccharide lyase 6 family protein [Verrucomicrobiota bacterium]